MKISVNNQEQNLDSNHNIESLLNLLEINLDQQKGLAIAVNQEILNKADWNQYKIKEGDKLILIRATQGG